MPFPRAKFDGIVEWGACAANADFCQNAGAAQSQFGSGVAQMSLTSPNVSLKKFWSYGPAQALDQTLLYLETLGAENPMSKRRSNIFFRKNMRSFLKLFRF